MIAKGITVSDPLVAREETITSLLSLESEIFGLELKMEETKKLRDIYNEKLIELPGKQLKFAETRKRLSNFNAELYFATPDIGC